MNFKQNLNYFKSSERTKTIGIALMVLSVALYFFGWGYLSYILMSLSLPAGLFLFFWGSGRRSTDSEIDECIKKATAGLETHLIEDQAFTKKLNKSLPQIAIESYEFDDGLMFTKSKAGSIRSSRYTKAVIFVLQDSLYIVKRSFSLIADETKDTTYEIPFSNIDIVELSHIEKDLTFEKKTFKVKFVKLNVVCGGEERLSLFAPDDVSTERMIERVNSLIQKATDGQ